MAIFERKQGIVGRNTPNQGVIRFRQAGLVVDVVQGS